VNILYRVKARNKGTHALLQADIHMHAFLDQERQDQESHYHHHEGNKIIAVFNNPDQPLSLS
jgi:hypothetical protein